MNPSEVYRAREFARVRDEAQFWRREWERANAKSAQLEAELKLRDMRDRTDVAWLQGKVVAQARELKRLNDAHNAALVMAGRDPVPDVDAPSLTSIEIRSRQYDAAHEARSSDGT